MSLTGAAACLVFFQRCQESANLWFGHEDSRDDNRVRVQRRQEIELEFKFRVIDHRAVRVLADQHIVFESKIIIKTDRFDSPRDGLRFRRLRWNNLTRNHFFTVVVLWFGFLRCRRFRLDCVCRICLKHPNTKAILVVRPGFDLRAPTRLGTVDQGRITRETSWLGWTSVCIKSSTNSCADAITTTPELNTPLATDSGTRAETCFR